MSSDTRLVLRGLAKLFQFSGRDNEEQFKAYFGFVLLSSLALLMMMGISSMAAYLGLLPSIKSLMPPPFNLHIIGGIYLGYIVLMMASVVSRRLHDRNKTAWLGWLPVPVLVYFVYLFWEFVTILPAKVVDDDMAALSFFLKAFLTVGVYFLTLSLLFRWLSGPGTDGPNRYGPEPD